MKLLKASLAQITPSTLLLVVLTFLNCGVAFAQTFSGGEQNDVSRMGSVALPPGFFNAQTLPTEPIPIAQPLTDWDPAVAMFLNLPIASSLAEPKQMAFFSELVSTLANYLPVYIGYDEEETSNLLRFESQLVSLNPSPKTNYGLDFFESSSRSPWLRDYGPLFGLDTENDLVVIDPIFRDAQTEIDQFTQAGLRDSQQELDSFILLRKHDRKSDAVPLAISRQIRRQLRQSTDTSRPPIFMRGGDYIAGEQGLVFISENLILANGGSVRTTKTTLLNYFGGKDVHILESFPNLPGATLADQLRLLTPNLMIQAAPPPLPVVPSAFIQRLTRLVEGVSKSNSDYIKEVLPHIEVFTIPTPRLVEKPRSEILEELRTELIEELCERIGVNRKVYLELDPSDPNRKTADRMIDKRLKEITGESLDLRNERHLDSAVKGLMGKTLEALLYDRALKTTLRRSYTTGVFFMTSDLQPVALLPRYLPRSGETTTELRAIEQQIEAAYYNAHPEINLHWINVDPLFDTLGGTLHQLCLPIPKSGKPQRSAKPE